MLASAVVLPEETSSRSPPSRKRRQSSVSSDNSKRPRLDTDFSRTSSHGSPPASATAMSPPARKSSKTTADPTEEKKRGKRLFGALLGTLSQTSAKPAHRRRDEIEKRQQEKVKQREEEVAEEKRLKRQEIDIIRREEQKAWDEQSMQVRHLNMRATANFLKTNTEPQLYYRPWELKPHEDDKIKHQIEDVENAISRELAEQAAKKGVETGMNEVQPPVSELPVPPTETTTQQSDGTKEDITKPELVGAANTSDEQGDTPMDDPTNAPSRILPTDTTSPTNGHGKKPSIDDNGGEELVEGQEDDVIY